jgi:hypothetical protein
MPSTACLLCEPSVILSEKEIVFYLGCDWPTDGRRSYSRVAVRLSFIEVKLGHANYLAESSQPG